MAKRLSIPRRIIAKADRLRKSRRLSSLPAREIADSHFHFFGKIQTINKTVAILKKMGIKRVSALNFFSSGKINTANLVLLCFKRLYPDFVYAMAGLTYPENKPVNETDMQNELFAQAEKLFALGFDGFKIIETKPEFYKKLPYKITSPVYNKFFETAEKLQLPIVWHAADPEEYWPRRYSVKDYPPKKYFYEKLISTLKRFPSLKIIFAHFLFLSKELDMACDILDEYPGVNFDLAPGAEMYLNFSTYRDKAYSFFNKYQDRILFGSDNLIGDRPPRAEDLKMRLFDIRNFLETDKTYRMFEQEVRGLKLPEAILDKIYLTNFLRVIGAKPRRLNIALVRKETEHAARVLADEFNVKRADNIGCQAERVMF